MTDFYFKCDRCGKFEKYETDNPQVVPAIVEHWGKFKKYRLCKICADALNLWMDEAVVHLPECPAARDDDAPEHELSCTCGGRDE